MAGCGGGAAQAPTRPRRVAGRRPDRGRGSAGGPPLGFPVFATKNTTRVAGGDAIADAAAIALATYPARTPESRPAAVILAEVRDWRTGHRRLGARRQPINAPILFADGDQLPEATKAALDALQPTGSKEAGGAQVIRVGTKAPVEGYKTTDIAAANPAALAAAVDRVHGGRGARRRARSWSPSADRPEYAMPAAGWAAKSGDPVLWVNANGVPAGDRGRDQAAQDGRRSTSSARPTRCPTRVVDALEKLGTVKRIAGTDAVTTAITFARYSDGDFGWSVVDPGHGLVFASTRRPQDAAAAAPLSASGTYGPLLLLTDAGVLPQPLQDYLLDIQPGYDARSGPRRLQPRLDHRRRERASRPRCRRG